MSSNNTACFFYLLNPRFMDNDGWLASCNHHPTHFLNTEIDTMTQVAAAA